ncbi:MAG TPA: biosynthetic arginine decarboxylase [Kofleriaceae bacterium]|nr:biosynthetic arginine decarboxylase [Kofleriaceae bacterium]
MADALETYGIERWGCGYFSINQAGNVVATPRGASVGAIDVPNLIDDLRKRGIDMPILLRFSDILRARIELLNDAFAHSIAEYEYKNTYRGVFPIKVNQSRRVVEEIIGFGARYHYGLEAGSKPELLAVMALHEDPEALIVCNGYKDDDYIQTALLASKLGRTVVLVVEKLSEVDDILKVSGEMGIKPTIGIRARLASRGAGKWESSGGDRSKFGLAAAEMVEAVRKLEASGNLEQLKLVHFHLGSQISSIRSIKTALNEAARVFAGLYNLGCKQLKYFDVGGGLGVDYDGSQTSYGSSINYSVQEYANDVVFTIQQVCDEAEVPHPVIISESGRAVAAHHAVLVVDVLGVSEIQTSPVPKEIPEAAEQALHNLFDTFKGLSQKNLREYYHDALEYREQVMQLFNLGHVDLQGRVMGEQLFWAVCGKALDIIRGLSHVPKEMEGLEKMLSDTYFCNFSMFQSLPDLWAVDQLFPIMPLHRLAEEPTRRGILADITCDSDGAIESFIDPRDVKHVLELHPHRQGEPYYLGVFLVGAYQEILGDLHNLFGDTNMVHVSIEDGGGCSIDEVLTGDTVTDVLRYVGYTPDGLLRKLRKNIEAALRAGCLTSEESRKVTEHFQRGMAGYTYLEPRQ